MKKLTIDETSGVDHPAHLDDGFIIVKQAEVKVPETKIDKDARILELEGLLAKATEKPPTVEDVLKESDPAVIKTVNDLKKQVDDQAKLIAKSDDAIRTREANDFVKGLEHVEVDAEMIKNLRATTSAEAVEAVLVKVNGQLESAGIFKELGTSGAEADSRGSTKINEIAKDLLAKGLVPTIQQGVAKAAQDNPGLYAESKES